MCHDTAQNPIEKGTCSRRSSRSLKRLSVVFSDATICETYGVKKQGGLKFTSAHVRGCHPLPAVAAGSGEVLFFRLRGGPAHTTRGEVS